MTSSMRCAMASPNAWSGNLSLTERQNAVVSNWRAEQPLAAYLEENGIPGIQGIDTRALTKKLRVRGALNGFISTEGISDAEAIRRAKEFVFVGVDYVKEVTHKEPFLWDQRDEQSANFKLASGPGEALWEHAPSTLGLRRAAGLISGTTGL